MLEQSFLDKHSSVRDIKRLQSEIQDLKNKMKIEIQNTEKWDPMFIYYLMISENYTYMEINTIRSLQENGISKDELNYINDLIRQEAFKQQVLSFKNSGNIDKVVANLGKKKAKEKDEFVDGDENAPSLEDKLIEMNYGQEQKDEMIYGHSIQ
jgi:dTDP-4-amino-4,6-dideoxygalactose transaminase